MASMDATFETILLVVGIFALAVVGYVSYTLEIRNAIHQRFLNSVLQSHVNRAAPLSSTVGRDSKALAIHCSHRKLRVEAPAYLKVWIFDYCPVNPL